MLLLPLRSLPSFLFFLLPLCILDSVILSLYHDFRVFVILYSAG